MILIRVTFSFCRGFLLDIGTRRTVILSLPFNAE